MGKLTLYLGQPEEIASILEEIPYRSLRILAGHLSVDGFTKTLGQNNCIKISKLNIFNYERLKVNPQILLPFQSLTHLKMEISEPLTEISNDEVVLLPNLKVLETNNPTSLLRSINAPSLEVFKCNFFKKVKDNRNIRVSSVINKLLRRCPSLKSLKLSYPITFVPHEYKFKLDTFKIRARKYKPFCLQIISQLKNVQYFSC